MAYVKVGAEFAINTETAGDQTNPQIATFADGSFLVTWVSREAWPGNGQTIKAQLFDASGARLGAEFQVNDQTTGAVFNQTATVLADGTVVVTWINNDTGTDGTGGVKARMFDSAGHALGGEFQVNTNETGSKFTAEIAALSNGGFVVTWDDWGSGDQKGQVYDASGAKVGGEFTTNVTTSGYQEYGDVIGLAGGGFIASWRSQGASGWDVYARKFSDAGTPLGGEFLVNTLTSGNQDGGRLTALADGGFVAVWLSSGAVKGQLFNAAGTKVGGEFAVNQSSGTLQNPEVTALADGSFFVAWTTLSDSQDSSGGVKVRQFGADGVPVANEMLLNTPASGLQFLPAIEALADGRVVASWVSETGDGSGYALRGQILYTANAAPEITSHAGAAVVDLSIAENEAAVTTITAIDADGPQPVTYRIAGGTDASAFVIDAASGALSFAAAPDFESPADANHDNVYQVVVEARDGAWTDSQAVNVTVTNLNDSLSFAQTALQAAETSLAAGVLSASGGTGNPISYAITGGADAALFALDAQTGALSFVEARDFEMPGDADGNNVYQVEVSASDGTYDVTRTISVTLNNVNEGLAIASDAAWTVDENTSLAGTVVAVDADGDTPSYFIAGGANAARFLIDSHSGALFFIVAPDFEMPGDSNNVFEVEVGATDGSLSQTQLLTITIADVDETAPLSIVTTAFEFAENTFINPALEVTGGLGTNLVTYWISGGADGALFIMDNDTDSLLLAPQDFEAPGDADGDNVYEIEVSVTDGDFFATQLVTVTVADVEEAQPLSIVNTSFAFEENSFIAAALEVTGGLGTDLVTYWISGGADGALFTMDNDTDSLLSEGLDFEAPGDFNGDNVYEIEVSVTDGDFFATQLVTVTVADVEEVAPLEFVTTAFKVPENAWIGALFEVTGGLGTNLTYAITGGADAALFAIGEERDLRLPPQDFEAPADADGDNVYEVEVTVSDGESFASELMTVTVTDEPDFSPIVFGDNDFDYAENVDIELWLRMSGGGPDITTLSFAITGGEDAGLFTIDTRMGTLFLTPRNFEARSDLDHDNVYEVEVTALQEGVTSTGLVTVKIHDINEAPVITSDGGGDWAARTIDENSSTVTYISAVDPDGGPVSYSLAGGADAGRFMVNASTGQLRFASAPNFEAPTDSDGNNVYEVIVKASSGGMIDTQALSISVANVVENLTLNGTSSSDQLTGGDGNDTIRGMGGNDVLVGLDGADMLEGGAGRDTMSGGLGADRFEFNATSESTVAASDMILDFNRAEGDKIVLSDIDASTRASGNQHFQFIGSAAFTMGSPSYGQLRAFQSGGDTYIQGDVNGDRVADFQIVIDGLVPLTSSDFVL